MTPKKQKELVSSGIEPAVPTLFNLPDRMKSLITGVGKFCIVSLFETDYNALFYDDKGLRFKSRLKHYFFALENFVF
jgi:hypothetical protein